MSNQRFEDCSLPPPARCALSVALVFFCYALVFVCVSSCVKLPRQRAGVARSLTTTEPAPSPAPAAPRIDINKASRAELERLPGIGGALAARIIEHRERHGAFRRVEHLIIVRGISERRFEALRPFINAE